MKTLLGALAATAFLAGCQTVPVSSDTARTDPVPDLLQPSSANWRVDVYGTQFHKSSGAACPREWRGFVRQRIVDFNEDGTDSGCNYQQKETGELVTVYVFTREHSVAVELGNAVEEMRLAWDSDFRDASSLPSELPIDYEDAAFLHSHHALGELKERVMVTRKQGWLVKLRATYLDEGTDAKERLQETMLADFLDSVTEIALGNGGVI